MTYWWIPVVTVLYALLAYLSQKVSDVGGFGFWFWSLILAGCLSPVCWAIVSASSKNLVIDGIIYQIAALGGFFALLLIFGGTKNFTLIHWIGFVLALMGVILLNIVPISK